MSGVLSSSLKRSLAAALLFGSVSATVAHAGTLDWGTIGTDASQVSINGLTINGVTLGFTQAGSPSPEALASTNITGATQYIDSQALTGPTDGVLTMSFADPIDTISFAVAETTADPLSPGFTVSLYDAGGNLLQTDPIDTVSNVLFSEGQFSYTGTAASSVVVSFDSGDANQFAMGAVSYNLPEPGDMATFAVALVALGAFVVRRRQA